MAVEPPESCVLVATLGKLMFHFTWIQLFFFVNDSYVMASDIYSNFEATVTALDPKNPGALALEWHHADPTELRRGVDRHHRWCPGGHLAESTAALQSDLVDAAWNTLWLVPVPWTRYVVRMLDLTKNQSKTAIIDVKL